MPRSGSAQDGAADGDGSPRSCPRDTDLIGVFYKKERTASSLSPVWVRTSTVYRELRRLGFSVKQDVRERQRQLVPSELEYLQPPPRSQKSSNQPKPDLCDTGSTHKYFLVLDGIDDIEHGAQAVLDECRGFNVDEHHRVVAFWVVSRVQRTAPRRLGRDPDLRRCPRLQQVLHFKQPRRSACMASSSRSPLKGLRTSTGQVVGVRSGAPGAVARAFVKFRKS